MKTARLFLIPFVLLLAASNARADDSDVVYAIPLRDSPQRGPRTAKITVVEFGDFQCPFCGRAESTLKQLQTVYDGEIRFVFKNNPLPFHQHAQEAAEAALAAGEQGKFWEMHDKLYAHQQQLDRADLERYAIELDLNLTRFRAALDAHKFRAQIERDQDDAKTFGASGTPAFFINGRHIKGAQPEETFEAVIDQEMKRANRAIADGTSRDQVYDAVVKSGKTKAEPPSFAAHHDSPRAVTIELGDSPQRGPADAKVTIVEWSDFQCPFCGRAKPTMDRLLADYPNDLRLVYKHEPLPFHPNAKPAALASEAARNQGKFWEFYDLAYANQKDLSPESYDKWARQLGLDLDRFHKDLENPATAARVEADSAAGMKVGANGTPTFFINGRIMVGALPYESFKTAVDEELTKADALLAKGVARSELYARLMADNVANAPKPTPAPKPTNAYDEPKTVAVPIGQAPTHGKPSALVTIVEYSDFQCPFCGRAEATLKQLQDKYGKDLRFVFKNNPLPFHPNAEPAAEAALAAGEQGKFWEMHDKLFANQRQLEREDLERYAQNLGLNMSRFKAALDSHKFKKAIEADIQEAVAVGATGTPIFYINGRRLTGAQPFEKFDTMVSEEKQHAIKLLGRGASRVHLYEALLKDAHAEQPTVAPPPDDDGEPLPSDDDQDGD